MYNITTIVELIVKLAVTVVVVFVVPWIKSKWDNEQLKNALDYVSIFVHAADQIYEINDGAQKKQWVIEQLAKQGFIIDDSIDAAIEAAVLELHSALRDN